MELAGLILGDTWQERVAGGLEVTVIGMTVVFAVLILLYYILVLVGRLAGERPARSGEDPATAYTPAAPTVLAPAEAEAISEVLAGAPASREAASSDEAGSRERLVAAICATLAAALHSEMPPAVPGPCAAAAPQRLEWTLAGRMDLLTAREQLPRG